MSGLQPLHTETKDNASLLGKRVLAEIQGDNIPLVANVLALQCNRQALVDECLLKANKHRIHHVYVVREQVYKHNVLDHSSKMLPTYDGPYSITQVHTNNTVTIRLDDNSSEQMNVISAESSHIWTYQVLT